MFLAFGEEHEPTHSPYPADYADCYARTRQDAHPAAVAASASAGFINS